MKTLFQDDLREAGYDLPTSGLCYNLNPEDSKALISEGEWLLAEDELVAREGESQQFLYMIVSGSVELSKKDEKGKQQLIANLGTGETFGEVAFLRGHIASATSETRGLCILWRMNHAQLLEFIGSHGSIAGQLCLNLAGLLADRLLKENKVVSKVKMDLEEAISNLRVASEEDNLKTSALKELQQKVDSLNHATRARKERVSKRAKFNSIAMSSLTVAFLAVIGMLGLYNSYDHDAPSQVSVLTDEIESMKKSEAFYLDLKKRLEAENEELLHSNNEYETANSSLTDELESLQVHLSERDHDYDVLKSELLAAKDQISKFQKSDVSMLPKYSHAPEDLFTPLVSKDFLDELIEWASMNTTLVFPQEVEILDSPVVVSDLTLSASIEIPVGGKVLVTKFHPVSDRHVVAQQLNSNLFMASIETENTNLMEKLAGKYVTHMNGLGKNISNPFLRSRFSQFNQN